MQAELDDFRETWNTRRVRYQSDKLMPSGHVPAHLLICAELYGGLDCRVNIPKEAVDELRGMLTDEFGPAEQHLKWVSDEFKAVADEVFLSIGSPVRELGSAWEIFAEMAPIVEQVLLNQ